MSTPRSEYEPRTAGVQAFTPRRADQLGTARPYLRLTWCACPLPSPRPAIDERGSGQHAHAVENLLPFLKPGARVLDVGSGSGYLSAVLHYLVDGPGVGEESKVVGIDHIPELVDFSVDNLKKDGLGKALESGKIKIVAGDGRKGRCICTV